jgi:hypothetical protein
MEMKREINQQMSSVNRGILNNNKIQKLPKFGIF